MAFSSIEITFNEDLTLTDSLSIAIDNGGLLLHLWTIVATRVSGFEVTEGTPTATLGETNAINFAFAFDDDLNGGGSYTVNQVLNVVTITATVEDILFTAAGSASDVDFVITNVNTTDSVRTNVRSSYLISAPINDGVSDINPESALFEVYIWDGAIGDKPVTPTYEYEKQPRFLNDQNIYIDIALQIKDFINNTFDGMYTSQSVFCSYDVTTTYAGGTIADSNNLICLNGYNGHFDGLNYIPVSDLMFNNIVFNINTGENINLPFFTGNDDYTVEFKDGASVLNTYNITAAAIDNTSTAVEYVSEGIAGVNNILITNDATAEETTLEVNEITECKYTPVKCTFINKEGALQDLWFFKAQKESLNVDSKKYKSNNIVEGVSGGLPTLDYSTSEHITKNYNVLGNKRISLNTGFIDEDNNIVIEELMLSERVWLTINSQVRPVNVNKKSLEYQTRLNDKLVKYTLDFEYSYGTVNNIR